MSDKEFKELVQEHFKMDAILDAIVSICLVQPPQAGFWCDDNSIGRGEEVVKESEDG